MFELERVVQQNENTVPAFLTVHGGDFDRILEDVGKRSIVLTARLVVQCDDAWLFDIIIENMDIVATLVECGAITRSVNAIDGMIRVEMSLDNSKYIGCVSVQRPSSSFSSSR